MSKVTLKVKKCINSLQNHLPCCHSTLCALCSSHTAAHNSNSYVLDAALQSLFISVPLEVKYVEKQFKNTVDLWNYPLNGSFKDIYIYNSYASSQKFKDRCAAKPSYDPRQN